MCTKQTGKKTAEKLFGLCSKRFNLCGLSVSWCIDWQESRQSDNPLKVCFHLLLKFYQMKNGGFISKTTAAPLSLQVSKSDEFLVTANAIYIPLAFFFKYRRKNSPIWHTNSKEAKYCIYPIFSYKIKRNEYLREFLHSSMLQTWFLSMRKYTNLMTIFCWLQSYVASLEVWLMFSGRQVTRLESRREKEISFLLHPDFSDSFLACSFFFSTTLCCYTRAVESN